MPDDESKSLDVLGIKPIADSIGKVTTATIDASAAFLSRICLPAAEEYGLLLRDRVRSWRAANIAAITKKAEENLAQVGASDHVHAHPRLVSNILEEGSWAEYPVVQNLWAGLLSSSCTESGNDDSNLVFINLLASITKLQAHFLDYACEHSEKDAFAYDLIQARSLHVTMDELFEITEESDIQRLDRELDHLRELGLTQSGLEPYEQKFVNITPTPLALHLYVRCQGSRESPMDYFNIVLPTPSAENETPLEDAT